MPCIYEHDFFVSYPHMPEENILIEFVEELVHTIRKLRDSAEPLEPVYLDRERLKPGFRWKPELAKALCHSRAMLVVYTADYFAREYCVHEWDAMLDLEMKRVGQTSRSMIIPIVFRAPSDKHGHPLLPERMQDLQVSDDSDFRSILTPKKQFANLRVRRKVSALLARIDELRRKSPDPKVDCDSYTFLTQSQVLEPPRDSFAGWG